MAAQPTDKPDLPTAVAGGKQLVVGNDAANQRVLKGDEKAAALLLALGPDYGRPIFDELDELEVKQLSRAMVRLGPITQEAYARFQAMRGEVADGFITRAAYDSLMAATR